MKYGALLSHINEPHGRDVIGPGSNHTHTLWCGSGERNWFGLLVCHFQSYTDPTILLPFLFPPSGNLLFNRWNGSSCIHTHTRIASPVTILFFVLFLSFAPFCVNDDAVDRMFDHISFLFYLLLSFMLPFRSQSSLRLSHSFSPRVTLFLFQADAAELTIYRRSVPTFF